MSGDKPRKLTDAEMAALDGEHKALALRCATQTTEQVMFLRKHIATDMKIAKSKRNALDQILEQGGFKLVLFRVTNANALSKQSIQVTYDIHDELWDYLHRAESELPRALRGFLDGGVLLDPKNNKATAEEPVGAQLTGKTKTGVPKYDSILEQRKGRPS